MKKRSITKNTCMAVPLLVAAIVFFVACNKKTEGVITVETKSVTNITGNSATTGGTVTSTGYTVGNCGICYSESYSPSLDDSFTKDHEGNGAFSSTLTNLKSGTKYYVRAYAKTSMGVEYGEELSFTTLGGYTINVFAKSTEGTVTGAGSYLSGETCTVTATAKEGYTFTNWTENGTVVSNKESYSFTVSGNRDLQANFKMDTFTITVSAEPSVGGGTVSGGGEYGYGKSCTVTATPYYLSTFQNWTENGEVVSSNSSYTFTVTGDRNLVANFSILSFSVTVSAYPSEGGTVSGGGSGFSLYDECTVKAVANPGYSFYFWSEDTHVVSYDAEYTFYLEGDRNLVANFYLTETGLPTVTTSNVTDITQSSATGGGNVTDDGGSTVFERGLCWSTSPNPTLENGTYTVLGSGTGSFSGQINGLYQNTTYYIRAFATNSSGTGYGEEITFMTSGSGQSDTWLYYDNDNVENTWGYINGGTLEWAVEFPASMLEPYVGMNIIKVDLYAGCAGTYYTTIYTGDTEPTTEIYSGYSNISESGWWNLTLHTPITVTAQNIWVSFLINHAAGEYPAGSSIGSDNALARWVYWGTYGWCDAYLSGWCNQDLTWIIGAYVSNGEKEYTIGSPRPETPSYKCGPIKARTTQKLTPHARKKPTK